MKRLYSLGDSFMSTDDPDDGIISFCELYCQRKGFSHVSLARPGATNFAIRLQIEKAIEQKADYVVVGITCSDRFDIALDSNVLYTLDNVLYHGYRAQSQRHVEQDQVTLISDTFRDIDNGTFHNAASAQQIQALKSYIAYLHNPALAVQKDYYIISDGLKKLQSAGIDFLLLPGYIGQHDWSWVKNVWPKTKPMPYQMPYGPEGWYDPPRYTGTHNPAHAHEEFCETMLSITKDWQ
jgi:hypothetical protein